MIEILNNIALNGDELHQEVEFLIPNFLPKRMITMFYADGGHGKTWLSYGVSAYLCEHNLCKAVYYLDFDNGIVTLKERHVDDLLIDKHHKLKYIQRSKLDRQPIELIEGLSYKAVANAYEDMVFIIDSLRNLTNVNDDKKAMDLMSLLMSIREAGGTILLVHHANKDGKNYQGSNNIKNSLDCMFKLTKLPNQEGFLSLGLNVEKERSGVRDCAFTVQIDNLELKPIEYEIANMSMHENDFIKKVQTLLKQNPNGLNQTALLEGIGSAKDNKTDRATLERFEDKFYRKEKVGNKYIYSLI